MITHQIFKMLTGIAVVIIVFIAMGLAQTASADEISGSLTKIDLST